MSSTNAVAVTVSWYHRPPFDRLDKLCMRMLDADRGVLQKQMKYFRLSVPQAFTGADLIQWLLLNLNLDDTAEALHMATILLEHGYIFPVIDRLAPIKDDNTLYRFQAPYFWISHSSPDDVEYAIYLAKRLLRNEEKHGLEPHEANAYNRLCELHGNKWDYISVAAEMQLKLHKDKKKPDKVVLDSQERAYWHIHRPPPPGNTNNFDEHKVKMEKHIRRKTARHYKQEIDILKFSLKTKPHFKAAKSTEDLVHWVEQFGEYDPLLCGCQPCNPWIDSDISYWTYNADYVEVPTERRVKRWGLSVQDIVNDPIGREVLESFLNSEFSSENIRFWVAVQDLKYSANSEVKEKTEYLYNEFLAPGASCQVNIDNKCLEGVTKYMNEADNQSERPLRYCFSEAEDQVFGLMARDSYLRFIRSEIYNNMLNLAQAQGSKRQGWRNIMSIGQGGAGSTTMGGGATTSNAKKSTVSTAAIKSAVKSGMSRDEGSQSNLKTDHMGLPMP